MLSAVADHLGGARRQGADCAVIDATHDSRTVEPGALFCALRGANVDGHEFAAAAVERGAAALLVERWVDVDRPQILVDDTRAAAGPAAAVVHGWPSRRLTTVGVTGTNGKTTVTTLVEAAFAAAGRAPGLIGTIASRIMGEPVEGERTTPESTDLQRLLAMMVHRGVDAVAMEVSSHGLDLHRVDGIEFDVAVFTNLSQDHLDWHGSMADYYRAKARLMTPELSRAGVIFIDDDWGRRLADETAVPTVRVGTGTDADVRMRDVHVDAQGGRAEVDWDGASMTVRTSLVGAFNVCNAVLAVVAAVVAGVPRDAACAGVAACSTIAGRLQRVDEGQPFAVYVDYAHTPAAVAQAITTLRGVHPDGRVIAVLGAGGDRDRSKRVPMGRALAEADVAVVTSDNPRSEDPAAIADELIAGVRDATRGGRNAELIVELDRHDAIQKAIAMARVGDVVLVAGKGHERQQVIADDVRTFDDVAVARMCLREVVA